MQGERALYWPLLQKAITTLLSDASYNERLAALVGPEGLLPVLNTLSYHSVLAARQLSSKELRENAFTLYRDRISELLRTIQIQRRAADVEEFERLISLSHRPICAQTHGVPYHGFPSNWNMLKGDI